MFALSFWKKPALTNIYLGFCLFLALSVLVDKAYAQSPSWIKEENEAQPTQTTMTEADPDKLKGRVEEYSKFERLERSFAVEKPLQRAVEVLPGLSAIDGGISAGLLKAETADAALDGLLRSGGFLLPGKSLTAKSDWTPLSDASLDAKIAKCRPCLEHYLVARRLGRGSGYDPFFDGWYERKLKGDDWRLVENKVSANLVGQNNLLSGASLLPDLIEPIQPFTKPHLTATTLTMPDLSLPPLEQYVSWSTWYQKVAALLLETWNSLGTEPGQAELRISVTKNRTITAVILKTTNHSDAFKNSLLTAVGKLDGSSTLTFPQHSARNLVTFESRFDAGKDTKPGAFSGRINDVERHTYLRKRP